MEAEVYGQSRCLASRAAHLYYLENRSQRAIAKELGVSVPSVSRLVRRAREEHLIQFAVAEPFASCLALERDLADAYGLTEVLVAPVIEGDADASKKVVALEGARLVQRLTTPKDILGIAWGGTMSHLIQYLNPCRRVPAGFVTLHGSISCCGPELDVANLVDRIAMAFGGRRHTIQAAGLQASAERVRQLGMEDAVRAVRDLYHRITISVSGVGSLYPELDSRLVKSTYLSQGEISELVRSGAHGDMMLRFFDGDGNECDTSMRERTVSIELDEYRRIPRRVVVACGAEKAQTLRAVLRGGLANLLVLDDRLARRLVALA